MDWHEGGGVWNIAFNKLGGIIDIDAWIGLRSATVDVTGVVSAVVILDTSGSACPSKFINGLLVPGNTEGSTCLLDVGKFANACSDICCTVVDKEVENPLCNGCGTPIIARFKWYLEIQKHLNLKLVADRLQDCPMSKKLKHGPYLKPIHIKNIWFELKVNQILSVVILVGRPKNSLTPTGHKVNQQCWCIG